MKNLQAPKPLIVTPPQIMWRISNYADLSGRGGLKASHRWHTRGKKIVYLADSSSGALLETLVHLEIDGEDVPEFYTLLKVEIPGLLSIQELELPPGNEWRDDQTLTQGIGDAWLASQSTPLAQVPSSIITGASNFLLNPDHPDAGQIEIASVTRERYDNRLFGVRSRH